MKNLSILYLATALLVIGCADDELSPIITFDKAGKGAYVRLLELRTGEYDLANFSSSALDYSVEFVDEQQGALVSSYDIYLSFDDNTPDNGDSSKTEILFKSFGQGDFGSSDRGFAALDVQIPLTEAASAVELTQDDLAAGDFFVFRSELILESGAKFTKANSSAAVNGSAFQGYFDYDGKVTCPLDDNLFSGSYQMEYVTYEEGAFGWCFGEEPGNFEITTVSGSSTLREFEYIWLPGAFDFGPNTLRFDIVCDETQPQTSDTGATCGGGTVTIGANPHPIDINDDSSFQLDLIEYLDDGGCNVGPNPTVVLFTKL